MCGVPPKYSYSLILLTKSVWPNTIQNIMITIIISMCFMFLLFKLNKQLMLENLALRQQLAVMKQSIKKPKIRIHDRIFWVILSRFWKDLKDVLIVVSPKTVIGWHRNGSNYFGRGNLVKEHLDGHE